MDKNVTMVITLVVYFLIIMGIALWSFRHSKVGLEDFFLMNRSVGTILGSFSLVATLLSGFTFLGMAGIAYFAGPSVGVMFVLLPLMMAVCFAWVGPTLWRLGKKHRWMTPGDFFDARYGGWQGKWLRQMSAWFFMVITLGPALMVQVVAGGYAFRDLFGWPYLAGAILVAVVIAVYTMVGGFRADVYTDLFQGVVMIVLLWVIAFWVVGAVGGLPTLYQSFAAKNPGSASTNAGFFTSTMWVSFMIMFGFSIFWRPDFLSRVYAIKDASTIRKMVWLFPIVQILISIPGPLLLGEAGRVVFEQLPQGVSPDSVVLLLIDRFLPPWMVGLVVAGLLAAIMSTADSQLIAASSLFSRDVIQSYRKDLSERAIVNYGRGFIVVMLILAFLLAINPPKLLVDIEGIMTSVILQFAPIVMLGIFWKRMTGTAAVIAMPLGVIIATAGVLAGGQLTLFPPLQLTPAIYALIVTTVTCVVVSYLTTQPATDVMQDLFGEEVEERKAMARRGLMPGAG